MTGSEIVWWLEDIWYDLLHLGTADIPLLLIRLFMLAVAVFFGWQLGRMVFRAVWAAVAPVLEFAWRVATAPVRLPVRGVKRVLRLLRRWFRMLCWLFLAASNKLLISLSLKKFLRFSWLFAVRAHALFTFCWSGGVFRCSISFGASDICLRLLLTKYTFFKSGIYFSIFSKINHEEPFVTNRAVTGPSLCPAFFR